MLARRLLIALALLMAITALAAGLAPRESAHREDASPTPSTSAAPEAEPVEATLDAASEGQLVKAEVGQIVRIVVNTDELDSVQVGDLGTETADPDSPTSRAPTRSSCSRPSGRSASWRSATSRRASWRPARRGRRCARRCPRTTGRSRA